MRKCRYFWYRFIPSGITQLPTLPGETDADQALQAQRSVVVHKKKRYKPLSLKSRVAFAEQSDHKAYHQVTPAWFGLRLDEFVSQHYPQWSRDAIVKLIQGGHIYRIKPDGKKKYSKVYDRLELNETLVVPTMEYWKQELAPPSNIFEEKEERREIPLSGKMRETALSWVLFKNEHVIVINKPPGIFSQPTSKGNLNLTDLLPAWKYTNTFRPFICHHLDAETSGIVVLARTKSAYRQLSRTFMKRVTPISSYWAFLSGRVDTDYGRIRMHFEVEKYKGGEQIIARATPTEKSRVGIAEYVVNYQLGDFGAFVSFYPLTARKHQLRIMAAHALRCPILGDAKFGGEAAFPKALTSFWDVQNKGVALHLHHRKVQLPYKDQSGRYISITAPLPPDMSETFKKFGFPENVDDPLIP